MKKLTHGYSVPRGTISRSVCVESKSPRLDPEAPAKAFLSGGTIFAPILALTMQFLAEGVFAQGTQLSAPPNQSPTPTLFTSSTASTVIAGATGAITLPAGTSVTLNAAASAGQAAALLATGEGATINATGTTVTNNNAGPNITFGVNATSPSGTATITLNDGSITTSSTGTGRAFGINAAVGGVVNATNVTIITNTTTSASHGAVAAGGTINLTNGSITTNGQFSLGLQANSNAGPATITANGTTIDTTGTNSSGAVAEGANAATIALTGATIATSGVGASGLFASGTGKMITAGSTNITTSGASSVVADSGAKISLTGGTVTLNATSGGQISALLATANQSGITATNTNIVNNNNQGASITFAVNATSSSGTATITLNGGSITTSATAGGRAYGINSALGGVVNASSVAITTNSANSHGVVAGGGTVNLTDGSITTLGRFSLGLQANSNTGPATITANGTTITTSGDISSGAQLTGSGQSSVSLTGVAIRTSGATASGALLDGSGSYTLNLNNSSITTTAATSDAIVFGNAKLANVTINNITIHPGSGNLLNSIGSTGSLTIENSTITGNIMADSGSTVDVNLKNGTILTAIIEGAHNVFIDPSEWIMPDDSFITGDLTLQGNLIINSTAKFAAIGEGSVLTIGGNFKMAPGSTLSLGIGGVNGEQYDRLVVGKNATLNGNLTLNALGGFHPAVGEAFEIIRTAGTTSGEFASFTDNITAPGLEQIVVIGPNGVELVPIKGTGPPVEEIVPEPLPPVDPEAPLPEEDVVRLLDPTAEQLTSLYEISFSGANIQRFNLGDRMTQIQRAGFVSPIPLAPPPPTGKEALGKAPLPPAPQAGPRWGVWANGWGDWVNVDNANGATGYRFTTGGMSAGIDYLITDHLAVGLFGGYSHTWVDFKPGDGSVDTGRGGLYATYFNQQGWWVNAGVWGGYNNYSTSRQAILGPANGSTDGYEISTFGEAGYNFHCGDLTWGPLIAMQYTNVHVSGFTEHGSLVPLDIHSDSQESLRTDVEAQASYNWHVGKTTVIPGLKLGWEHEYLYSNLPITGSAPAINNATATFNGPNLGHDSLLITANVGVQINPQISVTVGYDGQLARDHYISNAVTGTFSYSF